MAENNPKKLIIGIDGRSAAEIDLECDPDIDDEIRYWSINTLVVDEEFGIYIEEWIRGRRLYKFHHVLIGLLDGDTNIVLSADGTDITY